MQLVINKCFGGFSLSHAAVMRFAELSGFQLYAYVNARDENGRLDINKYEPIKDGESPFCIHYTRKPLVDGKMPNDDRYFAEREIKRDDPMLVKVVADMGGKANGMCADLRIVTIPDGVAYEIVDYDGMESIHEVHRTWS